MKGGGVTLGVMRSNGDNDNGVVAMFASPLPYSEVTKLECNLLFYH
ncbi:Uncharacterised protein [Photobacterium damselae]|uniref:Uncharacterized protein n=1 Tax=Photobacterium damselae TaxID=38293 RepID=A0A2X1ZLE4_PHODM|nr:Uncharacterised protein [Photobacterium damselae]